MEESVCELGVADDLGVVPVREPPASELSVDGEARVLEITEVELAIEALAELAELVVMSATPKELADDSLEAEGVMFADADDPSVKMTAEALLPEYEAEPALPNAAGAVVCGSPTGDVTD